MRPDNTRFLIQAARQRGQATPQRAIQALRDLAAASTPVTFQTVARAAGMSRSWLYGQPDLRAELERLRAPSARAPSSPPIPARQRAALNLVEEFDAGGAGPFAGDHRLDRPAECHGQAVMPRPVAVGPPPPR
jgi:hypothetical protein